MRSRGKHGNSSNAQAVHESRSSERTELPAEIMYGGELYVRVTSPHKHDRELDVHSTWAPEVVSTSTIPLSESSSESSKFKRSSMQELVKSPQGGPTSRDCDAIFGTQIPRVIHTIIMQDFPREDAFRISAEWSKNEPCFTHKVHSEASCHRLAADIADFDPIYMAIPTTEAQRNVCRLLVILQHGGVYIDYDISWREPLEKWFNASFDILLAQESKASQYRHGVLVSNWFFAARPQHPCIQTALDFMVSELSKLGLQNGIEVASTTIEHVTGLDVLTKGLDQCDQFPQYMISQEEATHHFMRNKHTFNGRWPSQRSDDLSNGHFENQHAPKGASAIQVAGSVGRHSVFFKKQEQNTPEPEIENEECTQYFGTRIPRIVHTIKLKDFPDIEEDEVKEKWKEVEPCFQRVVHNDRDCFEYAMIVPDFYPTYASIPSSAMQANLCRLIFIVFQGGIYLDYDVIPTETLRNWFDASAGIVVATGDAAPQFAHHYLFINSFFAARPQHPCIQAALNYVINQVRKLDFRSVNSVDKAIVDETSGTGAFTAGLEECTMFPQIVSDRRAVLNEIAVSEHFAKLSGFETRLHGQAVNDALGNVDQGEIGDNALGWKAKRRAQKKYDTTREADVSQNVPKAPRVGLRVDLGLLRKYHAATKIKEFARYAAMPQAELLRVGHAYGEVLVRSVDIEGCADDCSTRNSAKSAVDDDLDTFAYIPNPEWKWCLHFEGVLSMMQSHNEQSSLACIKVFARRDGTNERFFSDVTVQVISSDEFVVSELDKQSGPIITVRPRVSVAREVFRMREAMDRATRIQTVCISAKSALAIAEVQVFSDLACHSPAVLKLPESSSSWKNEQLELQNLISSIHRQCANQGEVSMKIDVDGPIPAVLCYDYIDITNCTVASFHLIDSAGDSLVNNADASFEENIRSRGCEVTIFNISAILQGRRAQFNMKLLTSTELGWPLGDLFDRYRMKHVTLMSVTLNAENAGVVPSLVELARQHRIDQLVLDLSLLGASTPEDTQVWIALLRTLQEVFAPFSVAVNPSTTTVSLPEEMPCCYRISLLRNVGDIGSINREK